MMQRAERILLVASGTLAAAWCATHADTAWLTGQILGGTMVVCAVASTATAINRWLVAFRELARRDATAAEKVALAVAASAASAAAPSAPPPHFKPIPAKLRESAELGLSSPR
jgi:hypothetical protein